MNDVDLRRSILDAHDRGDARELARLQQAYRALPVTRSMAGGVRLVGRATTTRTTPKASPPLAVRLTSEAHWLLRQIPFESCAEHGSWLLGHRTPIEIIVEQLRRPREGSTRGERDYILFDPSYALEMEQMLGAQVIGALHSHPSGEASLSRTDVEASRRWATDMNEVVVDVLVTPVERFDGFPWVDPALHCWVTSPGSTVRPVPLIVEEAWN